MALIHYGYFLFGIVILFIWRLFHLFPYFKRTPYPTPGRSCIWFAMFGSIYLLVLINMLQNVDSTLDGYLALLPLILFIITLINFWGESFIAPTKNYLISLGLGILIGTIFFLISHHLFLLFELHHILSYLELVPILIGITVGILAGKIFYKIFRSRYPDWTNPLWQANKFWDIINHSGLLLVVTIVAFIEGLFQMLSTSLVILLTSL